MRVEKLNFGDYACEYEDGIKSNLYWERKSIPDLYGTMTTGYSRFKNEMERAKQAGARLELIVEGTLGEVADGFERSQFEGKSMMKKLGTLWHKYGLYTVYCSNRSEMAAYMLWRFESEGFHRMRNYSKEAT